MIIIGLLLTLVVLAFLCWVLFQLAVYALPFFAGLSLGLALMHNGAGPLISIACGILASAATLVAGQLIFTSAPSAIIRLIVTVIFVIPAVLAGYHAAHGVCGLGISSETWRSVIGVAGAVIVGATAFSRLVQFRGGAQSDPAPAYR